MNEQILAEEQRLIQENRALRKFLVFATFIGVGFAIGAVAAELTGEETAPTIRPTHRRSKRRRSGS